MVRFLAATSVIADIRATKDFGCYTLGMALFDTQRTSSFILSMFAYALFSAALVSPAVETKHLNGSVYPDPGWLCLFGSFFAFVGGTLNTIQFESLIERLSMVSFLPCNICVLHIPSQ